MALNRSIAVLAETEVTASSNSSSYTNRDCRGVAVIIKNTAAGAGSSPTLTVKLQGYVTGAGWVDITGATTTALDATSAATTTGATS